MGPTGKPLAVERNSHNFEEAAAVVRNQVALSRVNREILGHFMHSSIPHVLDLHHDRYDSS